MNPVVLVAVLVLFAFLGLWIKYGLRAAVVVLMVAGAVVSYMAYAGVFNTTQLR